MTNSLQDGPWGRPLPPPEGQPVRMPAPAPRPAAARRGTGRAALAGGLVGAVVAAAVSFGVVAVTDDDPEPAAAPVATSVAPLGDPGGQEDRVDVRAILDAVAPSVVAIEIGTATDRGVFEAGAGSGLVIDDEGLVLTNAHVVDGADTITVRFGDGQRAPADLVGTSPRNDIALVRLRQPMAGLRPATLGDSAALEVGDEVVAIGNALNLGDAPTVTRGIVSAKGRSLEAGDLRLENLLQTDAAINRGNSGGPLLDAAGRVVGINSAGIPGGQNLGFAIEIDAVKPLIAELSEGGGEVSVRAFLGVRTVDAAELDQADRDRFGITEPVGAVVVVVQAGSAAADAGLRVGDVVTALDGQEVSGSASLREAIQAQEPGTQVRLELRRDGRPTTVEARLGSQAVTE
jgi:S1-C subfamily serine protease